jgi:hypothetical protein
MLIDDGLDSYVKASEDQTTQFAQETVGNVHYAGGRFLMDYGAGWAQLTNVYVIHKRWPMHFVAFDRKATAVF